MFSFLRVAMVMCLFPAIETPPKTSGLRVGGSEQVKVEPLGKWLFPLWPSGLGMRDMREGERLKPGLQCVKEVAGWGR